MAASTKTPPARVHVLLAPNARRAVILRRGPAGHVASILWDCANDTFRLGQWLKGRIYEEKADISPDGRHWIYLALNGRWQSESKGSWIAVARAPYLKALAFYPMGDTWGGAFFLPNGAYYLPGETQPGDRTSREVRRMQELPKGTPKHWPPIIVRMVRNGWTQIEGGVGLPGKQVLERDAGDGWTLRYSTGWPRGSYELRRPDRIHLLDGWEWADLEQDRFVWVQQGCLYAGRCTARGIQRQRLLHDFNPMKFEAIEAPY